MTLYRKYRSQKLSELVGQSQVSEMLGRTISTGAVAHAYLFAGPRGTGKTSVARILAKAINCLNTDDKVETPCNECAHCIAINKGSFLDVVELDAASNTGVDNMREIIDQAHAVPVLGKYKVYILDEVHMLSTASFNALLKTLEEPPAHVVFVLCTTESHKVPITVASRCQRYVFSRANNNQLQQLLRSIADKEKANIEDNALSLLAQLADGGYRDGVMLLDQVLSAHSNNDTAISRESIEQQLGLAGLQVTQLLIEQALAKQTEESINTVEKFVSGGGEVRYLLLSLIEQLRTLMLALLNADVATQDIPEEQRSWFASMKSKTTVIEVIALLKRLMAAQQQKTSVEHTALSLEMALIDTASGSVTVVPAPSAPAASPKPKTTSHSPHPASRAPEAPPAKLDTATPEQPVEFAAPTESIAEAAPSPAPVEPPADLIEAWQQVLKGVQQQNRSVGALLQHHCTPLSHNGTILMLQFWNSFHKKQVEVDKNRLLVEKVAASVFGQPIKLKGELADKSLKPKKQPMTEEDIHNLSEPENDLTDVASEIFGGEFVD